MYDRLGYSFDYFTVDSLFVTFLVPFVVFVLVQRFLVWRKKRNPSALPLLSMAGLSASGLLLWVLTI